MAKSAIQPEPSIALKNPFSEIKKNHELQQISKMISSSYLAESQQREKENQHVYLPPKSNSFISHANEALVASKKTEHIETEPNQSTASGGTKLASYM